MKTSILIQALEKSLKEDGDLPVRIVAGTQPDSEKSDCAEFPGFVTILNRDDSPAHLMLCDRPTIEAFQ